ncbi:hypothetical protein ACKWTF_014135 [Chironomus riparius]
MIKHVLSPFSCQQLISAEMLKFFIIFAVFMAVKLPHVKSEFVTLWTPKFVQEDAIYRLFVLPTDLSENTEVAVQFRKTSAAYTMANKKIGAIEYGSKQRNFGDIKSYDLTMTLLRNVSTGSGTEMHCSTKTISVDTKTGGFYNFIQTDKPIYKPGDVVQFRVLTVDKDLLPYHRNSINVTIADPAGRVIYNFQNQAGKFMGVFDDKFTLSTETTLGDWMITVIVDKKDNMAVSKIFAVQKYTLPLFDPQIDLPEVHVIKDADMLFSVYAKYSFGEYVKGTAEVFIRRAADKYVFYKETFNNVYEPKVITKNLKSIGVQTLDIVQLEVFVIFTEPTSGMHFNKTVPFFAHSDDKHKLVPVHTEKFLPGFPFTVKVFIYDWKNVQMMSNFEQIELTYYYEFANGTTGNTMYLGTLENGVYLNEFEVPLEYIALTVDVKFTNSDTYNKKIEKGTVEVGMKSLIVSHKPTNPNLYDTIKIFITSDQPLNVIIYAIVTRYGNTDSKQVDCKGQLLCDFELDIAEEMMPHSTIMVYDVKDQQTIYQGQTEIETDNLGRNHLTVELPKTKAKTKEEINIKFSTKAKSTVYMLAFDKRLTFLRDGNDIVKDDIMTSVADYDGENKILVDDMQKWSICTPEEVERVASGRTYVVNQGGTDTVYPEEPDDPSTPSDNSVNPDFPPTKDGLLREYFPETWIFETIEVGKQSTFAKSYTTPDSMTTWLISAFSVHKDHGIALSPRQDLIVMEEFFLEMNLPYSIRYTEVLKLDILIFNYVDTKETITVDLKLNNLNDGMEFQFVDYSSDCTASYHDGTEATAKSSVEANGVSTVHFYIRSHPLNNEFDELKQKLMTLDIEATAKSTDGRTYRDHVQKKLIVDPVGIKVYMVMSDFFKLDGETTNPNIQTANFSQDLSNIDVVVTGDFLTDSMDIENEIAIVPSDCLEQSSIKFKRNIDTFHYLDVKGKNPSKSHFTEQYQAVLARLKKGYSYGDTASFRANLANMFATGMSVGAVPLDKKVLFEQLDIVRDKQESNGTFTHANFDFYYGFPYDQRNPNFVFTEQYIAAAYCIIPVIRYRNFMDGRYDNLVNKAFKYLDDDSNRLQVMRHGLSVASYVYALNNQPEKAKNLLKVIEQAYIHYEDNKKCYKIVEDDPDCDIRHTSYVALTYLKLNDLISAEPIVYYLMDIKEYSYYWTETRYLSIITEPIAEMGVQLNVADTNLGITIKDEKNFRQDFTITDGNSAIPQSIEMPSGSAQVSSVVSGKGYCTVTSIFERLVRVPVIDNTFSLTVTTRTDSGSGMINIMKTVQVCAKYNKQTGMKPVLVNVLYEVEMPSGYIFIEHKEIRDSQESRDKIKEVVARRQNTVVNLYYEDFQNGINYCVDLKATQKYSVNEAVNAGVKVYDYNNKGNFERSFNAQSRH